MTNLKTFVRPMVSDDAEMVLNWRNHPDVRRYMYTQQRISLQEHTAWFDRCQQDNLCHLLVFEHCGVPSGFASLIMKADQRLADWGFYLSPDARKGISSELGFHTLNYGFNQLGLHKICGEAIEYNNKSIQFHLRMGFQQEGILRDQHFDGQKYHSVIRFGILEQEWQPDNKEIMKNA